MGDEIDIVCLWSGEMAFQSEIDMGLLTRVNSFTVEARKGSRICIRSLITKILVFVPLTASIVKIRKKSK